MLVPGRDSNPRPLDRESDTLPQHHDATPKRNKVSWIWEMVTGRIALMTCYIVGVDVQWPLTNEDHYYIYFLLR